MEGPRRLSPSTLELEGVRALVDVRDLSLLDLLGLRIPPREPLAHGNPTDTNDNITVLGSGELIAEPPARLLLNNPSEVDGPLGLSPVRLDIVGLARLVELSTEVLL